MSTLLLRFPARRYHATPWRHHVNEGLIEWPPSPWRLLRALLSTGYTALAWPGDSAPDEARSLIEKLSGVLPQYRLPAAAGAHSRHYMPIGILDKGREKTTLVFDTWAQVDDGELAVTWDVELTEAQTRVLSQLTDCLGYLGRSESWVLARLAGPEERVWESNCIAELGSSHPGPGWEQVPLLAPCVPTEYLQWRETALQTALSQTRTAALRRRINEAYPPDLIACLQVATNGLRKYGWSQPPGSRRVFYWREIDALESGAPKPRRRAVSASSVEAVLLSMATAKRNDHALPSIARTLPQAERLHKQLGDTLKRMNAGHSRVLSGCDEHRRPLAESHTHAHILPLDLDDDGHLEHILIWAPMKLDGTAQKAIRMVRETFTKGGVGPLKLALEAAGSLSDLRRGLPAPYGDRLRALLGPDDGTTEWISITPFVPPRYVKPHGRNSLEGQLVAELASRALSGPLAIRRLDPMEEKRIRTVRLIEPGETSKGSALPPKDGRWLRMRHFARSRRLGPAPPIDCGFALSLRFAAPVRGPLCLGYGSHFGLGLFAPAPDA